MVSSIEVPTETIKNLAYRSNIKVQVNRGVEHPFDELVVNTPRKIVRDVEKYADAQLVVHDN